MLLFANGAFAQEKGETAETTAKDTNAQTLSKTEPHPILLKAPGLTNAPVATPAPAGGDPSWHFELRPYLWAAGMYGTLRVGNQTAQVGKDSKSVIGMLDFAAAAQVEAIRGRWRLIIDENYANLGTTGTGPGGLVTLDVQPTQNILEVGGSYMPVMVPNSKSTAAAPYLPLFTTEVLFGVRWYHLNLQMQANNAAPFEGNRNLLAPFVGGRFRTNPTRALGLIGKFTVGTSGVKQQFAWTLEGLADLRLNKSFSLGGGYRALGMNADDPNNRVGFNGTMRGIVLNMTLYR
jgi:hypothetical protein